MIAILLSLCCFTLSKIKTEIHKHDIGDSYTGVSFLLFQNKIAGQFYCLTTQEVSLCHKCKIPCAIFNKHNAKPGPLIKVRGASTVIIITDSLSDI